MYKMRLVILFLLIQNVFSYLTPTQWTIIDNSIRYYRQMDSKEFIQPIHDFIYCNHHNWTLHFTNTFVKKNNFYLNKNQKSELYVYATRGLLKAINNYDGYGNFYGYSKIYMNGELYKGISDLGPMRLLPHSYRVNKKWKQKNKSKYDYYNQQIEHIPWKGSYISNINANTKMNILSIVNELDNQERLLFSLRYDEHMNKRYTLNQIGDFYGYSTETIRRKIKNLHNAIKEKLYGLL